MATPFLNGIDLTGRELQNATIQNLATAPSSPVIGRFYYDTTIGTLRIWNGTVWINLDVTKIADGTIVISKLAVNPLLRTNHNGVQNANTISDFDTQVRTNRLDQLAAPTSSVSFNGQRITGVGTPTAPTDVPNRQYVDDTAASAAAGIDGKASVRVIATTNITLSGLQPLDGVTIGVGDRILATGQTNASQNGFWNAATGAWTRTLDADSNSEVTPGAFTFVEEGAIYAGTQWRLATPSPITLGTTNLTFTQFGVGQTYTNGSGVNLTGNSFSVKPGTNITVDTNGVNVDTTIVARKFTQTLGDGSATSFTIAHNLNNKYPTIALYSTANPFGMVFADYEATSVNSLTVRFATAPATGAYQITVVG